MLPRTPTGLAAVLITSAAAHAQLNIDWYTIDGGGGSSSGASFSLTGTIGQPDAAGSAGGAFTCGGGFWGTPPASLPCYANCDASTGVPALTANDFQCFINAYAAAAPSANCDLSTGSPSLTANDFQCFINAYAAGCP